MIEINRPDPTRIDSDEPDNLPDTTTPFVYWTIADGLRVECRGAIHLDNDDVQQRCGDCEDGVGFRDAWVNDGHTTVDCVCDECQGTGWVKADELCAGCGCRWVVTELQLCVDCLVDAMRAAAFGVKGQTVDRHGVIDIAAPLDADEFRVNV